MIQLYCGQGKGKTTAAVGAAVRAAGRGRQIVFAQFLKGRETGETAILSRLECVRVLRSSRDFPFFSQMTEREKKELTDIHNEMLDEILGALEEKRADFIVLDEITHACMYGMADTDRLGRILSRGGGMETEIILTGRNPPADLLEISDYISEIHSVRHPYEKGLAARYGVEL